MERNGRSLWFTIFLVKLLNGEMIKAGWELNQDIAEVNIYRNILMN